MPKTHKKTSSKGEDVKQKAKATMKGKKGGVAMQSYQTDQAVNPLVGAAIGAAVGGVVGAAAAVALSDKDTREKVKEVATSLRDQAANRIEDVTMKAKETAKVAKEDMQQRLQEPDKEKAA